MSMERSNRNVWLGVGVVVALLLGLSIIGHQMPFAYGMRPFFGAGPWFWGFGLAALLVRLVIWGALIALVIGLFRGSWRRTPAGHNDLSSLEILNRRYAAGEITREQYDEMRRTLNV
jgi:putative membrane protein